MKSFRVTLTSKFNECSSLQIYYICCHLLRRLSADRSFRTLHLDSTFFFVYIVPKWTPEQKMWLMPLIKKWSNYFKKILFIWFHFATVKSGYVIFAVKGTKMACFQDTLISNRKSMFCLLLLSGFVIYSLFKFVWWYFLKIFQWMWVLLMYLIYCSPLLQLSKYINVPNGHLFLLLPFYDFLIYISIWNH